MDLSKLSSNLPLSASPTDEALSNLNKELSDEFKVGARSIAALYRLSNTKNSLLVARGYLDCLNEISAHLESGNIASLADLSHFISAKKSDLSPETGATSTPAGATSPNTTTTNNDNNNQGSPDRNIVQNGLLDGSFKFSVEHPTAHHFPHSRTPLSVDHHNLKYYSKPVSLQKKIRSKPSAAATSSDEEEFANVSQEDRAVRRHPSSGAIDEDEDEDDEEHIGGLDDSFDENAVSASLKRKILDNSNLYKKQKLADC